MSSNSQITETDTPPKQKMFDFKSGGWIAAFSILLFVLLTYLKVNQFLHNRTPLTGDGKNTSTYGFDLSTCLIPQDEIIGAGMAKDGVEALIDPPKITAAEADWITKNERGKYLVPGDRIIGVEINGEACAYPLQILNWHEAVNDTLGGQPILVSYHPLCDSVVTFSRQVGEDVLEFGISGLLYNSNQILYDRHSDPAQESLWNQLQARAIAGPAANTGKTLQVLPCELVRWDEWRKVHPDTKVLKPDPELRSRYKRKPYSNYFGSDLLWYPVNPALPKDSLPNKTQIVVAGVDGKRKAYNIRALAQQAGEDGTWETEFNGRRLSFRYCHDKTKVLEDTVIVRPTDGQGPINELIYCFRFSWYAMYPDTELVP